VYESIQAFRIPHTTIPATLHHRSWQRCSVHSGHFTSRKDVGKVVALERLQVLDATLNCGNNFVREGLGVVLANPPRGCSHICGSRIWPKVLVPWIDISVSSSH
jgi:hypothetical protein